MISRLSPIFESTSRYVSSSTIESVLRNRGAFYHTKETPSGELASSQQFTKLGRDYYGDYANYTYYGLTIAHRLRYPTSKNRARIDNDGSVTLENRSIGQYSKGAIYRTINPANIEDYANQSFYIVDDSYKLTHLKGPILTEGVVDVVVAECQNKDIVRLFESVLYQDTDSILINIETGEIHSLGGMTNAIAVQEAGLDYTQPMQTMMTDTDTAKAYGLGDAVTVNTGLK